MKKILLFTLIPFTLMSCDVSKKGTQPDDKIEAKQQSNEVESDGQTSTNIEYPALTDIYSAKKTSPIDDGLYINTTLVNNTPIKINMIFENGVVTKSSDIVGQPKSFTAKANYSYAGSVLKYKDINGDAFLFNPEGEAFIKTKDGGFSLVDICDPNIESSLPTENSLGDSGTFCKDHIMLTVFTKSSI